MYQQKKRNDIINTEGKGIMNRNIMRSISMKYYLVFICLILLPQNISRGEFTLIDTATLKANIPFYKNTLGILAISNKRLVVNVDTKRICEGQENIDLYSLDLENNSFTLIDDNTNCEFPSYPSIFENTLVYSDINPENHNIRDNVYVYDFITNTKNVMSPNELTQARPDIYNRIVVWSDNRPSGNDDDIYGYDLDLQQEFPISTALRRQSNVAIYENIVVWEDGRISDTSNNDIFGYNLDTQVEFAISTEAGPQSNPDIYGNIVVWNDDRDKNGKADIYGYDLNTNQEFLISGGETDKRNPVIFGDIVVWSDTDTVGGIGIMGYNLATQQELCFTKNCGREPRTSYDPTLSGNLVVWVSPTGISAFDLLTNSEISNATEVLLGDKVVGNNTGAFGGDLTIHGYNDRNDVWYYFIPTETKKYSISLCGSDFDTTLAVFDETQNEIEFNDNHCNDRSQLILRGKAGKKYFIRIAGYDMDSGNYELEITDKINKK